MSSPENFQKLANFKQIIPYNNANSTKFPQNQQPTTKSQNKHPKIPISSNARTNKSKSKSKYQITQNPPNLYPDQKILKKLPNFKQTPPCISQHHKISTNHQSTAIHTKPTTQKQFHQFPDLNRQKSRSNTNISKHKNNHINHKQATKPI